MHGIENCGTAPNTVHETMPMSHENIVRPFRVCTCPALAAISTT
jgi:hypothetical protein